VSESTRQKVAAAIQSVGYAPNLTARAMRMGRSRAVGIVVADLQNPFYPEMLSELSSAFDEAGYRVVVWIAAMNGNEAALQAIRERAVDGVVFTTATSDSAELRFAIEQGSPLVLVNRPVDGAAADQVVSDNAGGARRVARYLLGHGRERIAFVGGPPAAATSRARREGFVDELAQRGVTLAAGSIVDGEYRHEDGVAALRTLLAHGTPDAIFCANDILAFGVIDGLRDQGLRVPDDVWVIGYDDIQLASWGAYSLTTIRQDIPRSAAIAARLLIGRIENARQPLAREVLPPDLVVRGSTGWAAAGDIA
jgi:LacI family transcriptional regulator